MADKAGISQSMAQELAALRSQNAKLQAIVDAKATSRISFKVSLPREAGTHSDKDKGSDGGAVSVYGLGRFPVTLYKGQWEHLFAVLDDLKAFIEANEASLSVK
jgi:hypothetical protein